MKAVSRSAVTPRTLAERSAHEATGSCTSRAVGISLNCPYRISMWECCAFFNDLVQPLLEGLALIDEFNVVEVRDLAQALEPPRDDLRGSDHLRQRVARAFDNDSRLDSLSEDLRCIGNIG